MKDIKLPPKGIKFPEKDDKKFPKIAEFFTKIPLFKKINLDKVYIKTVSELFEYDGKLESYCPDCKKERIFLYRETILFNPNEGIIKPLSSLNQGSQQISEDIIMEYGICVDIRTGKQFYEHNDTDAIKMFYCSANSEHSLSYYIKIRDNNLIKVGQFPTVHEISLPNIEKYRQILTKEEYEEFNTSLKLFSDGIGIGSYVYLRRILENLIEKKHKVAKKNEA